MQTWEQYAYGVGLVDYPASAATDTYEIYTTTSSSTYSYEKRISTSTTSTYTSAYSTYTYLSGTSTLKSITSTSGSFNQIQTTTTSDSTFTRVLKTDTGYYTSTHQAYASYTQTYLSVTNTKNGSGQTKTTTITIYNDICKASKVTGITRYSSADPGNNVAIYTSGTYGLPYPSETSRVTSSYSYVVPFGNVALFMPATYYTQPFNVVQSTGTMITDYGSAYTFTETFPFDKTQAWLPTSYTNSSFASTTDTRIDYFELWTTAGYIFTGSDAALTTSKIQTIGSSTSVSSFYILSRNTANQLTFVSTTRPYLRIYDGYFKDLVLGEWYANGNMFPANTYIQKPDLIAFVDPQSSSGAYAQKMLVYNGAWWSPAYNGAKPTPVFSNTILKNYPSWNSFQPLVGAYSEPSTTISPLLYHNQPVTGTASGTSNTFISSYTWKASIDSGNTSMSRTDFTTTGLSSGSITTTGSASYSTIITFGASTAPFVSWDSTANVYNGNIINLGGYIGTNPIVVVAGDNNTQTVTRISTNGSTTTAVEVWAAGSTIVSDGGVVAFRTNKPVQFGGAGGGEYATGIPVAGTASFDRGI